MFQTSSTTIAIFLAAAVAILIWVILNKTTFGYAEGRRPEQERRPLRWHQRRTSSSPWLCRRSGRLRRTLLPVNVSVEPAELHQPADHDQQRHLCGPAGRLNPIGTIFSIFISHISVSGSFLSTSITHRDLDLIQRYHHPVRILHVLFPWQDPPMLFKNADRDPIT